MVGVGLLRNVASLVTGMTLSGLIACRIIPERLGMPRPAEDDAGPGRHRVPVLNDRGDAGSRGASPGRLTAPRLAACGLATMLLSLWGFLVGTFIGWQAAGTLMGSRPSTSSHVLPDDLVSRCGWDDRQGALFRSLTGHPLLRERRAGERPEDEAEMTEGEARRSGNASNPPTGKSDLAGPIVRAACLSMIAILILNMSWFILVYHAVPVYGPSLLQPPSP